MMRHLFKAKTLFAFFAGCGLFACTKAEDPYFFLSPKLPVTRSFSIEKAGNKASIDFWVLPNAENATRLCDVMFVYHNNESNDTKDAANKIEIPLKIKISYIQNDDKKPVEATTWSQSVSAAILSVDPSSEKRHRISFNEGDAYLVDEMTTENGEYMSVASFKPEKFGQYRIEIETIKDQPIFNNRKSEIVVSQDFSHGK